MTSGNKRKGLERKDELRLYEWMKSNYEQLSGKTVTEGATLVAQELGLDISNSTIMSMVRDMDMQPFWRARVPKPENEDTRTTLQGHAKAILHQREAMQKLTQVCENMIDRLERLENRADDSLANQRLAHMEDVLYQVMVHLVHRHHSGSRQGILRLMGEHKEFVGRTRETPGDTESPKGVMNGRAHDGNYDGPRTDHDLEQLPIDSAD